MKGSACPFADQIGERGFGTRAIVGNDFRRRDRAHAQRRFIVLARAMPGKEAGGKGIARPGRIDKRFDIFGVDFGPDAVRDAQRALFTACGG